MKKALLLIFTSFLLFQLNAQVSLVLGSATTSAEGTKDDDAIIAKTTILNDSPEKKTILWERTVLSITDGWGTAVCDKNLCYDPSIEAFEFELDSMEEASISVYGYPLGKEGATSVEIKLTDANDPNNTVTGSFQVKSDGFTTTNTRFVAKPNIKIYPNPTSQYISLTDATNVDRLMVYNIVGRSVKNFRATSSNQYDVSNLPVGIYLVRLVDRFDYTLRTVRLRVDYP